MGLLSLAWLAGLLSAAPTHRLRTRPGFSWPQTEQAAYAANRIPKKDVLTFLAAGLGWPANDMPYFGDFRFAQLGPKEICLVAAWGLRDASMEEVICPAAGGGYWDTSLPHYAPEPLAWSVTDLKGDGICEVISSPDAGYMSFYWYDIYSFTDGRPHKVSGRFPQFYKAALLPQLSRVEGTLRSPFAQEPLPPRARFAKMFLLYTQLKYQRRILGDKKTGLDQGIAWTRSHYIDVQGLGLATLAEIRSPRSIATLRQLGSATRNQGICVGVVNALASLEGRAPGGVVSDAGDIDNIQKCDEMRPAPARLLQNLPASPRAQ